MLTHPLKSNQTAVRRGFTIVELLIVIVVIAILAAITVVAYNGVSRSAKETSLKSDLRNTATQLAVKWTNEGTYPGTLESPVRVEGNQNALTYSGGGSTYCVSATTKSTGGPVFHLTQDGQIRDGACPVTWSIAAAGCCNTASIATNGALYTWGSNSTGQLGDGTTTSRLSPIRINSGPLTGQALTQASTASSHTLVLGANGNLYGWGGNAQGQLGDGSMAFRTSPVAVSMTPFAGKTVKKIAVGGSISFVLTNDGIVYTWGQGYSGALGAGNVSDRSTPTAISSTSFGNKVITDISLGHQSAMALAADGTVYTWGYNNFGQVGNGNTSIRNSPYLIPASAFQNKTIVQISADENRSIALASDGTLFTWGLKLLPGGGNSIVTTPEVLSTTSLAGKTAQSIVAGTASFILMTDGTLYGWGHNQPLGVGTDVQATPVQVATGTLAGKTISKIYTSGARSFAITSDGALHAWGDNYFGQIGDGTTTSSPVPMQLPMPVNP